MKNKKAFTVVELVVVIAIIAVLAAVLIPTFVTIVKKANVSKDTQLIRNLNTALAVDSATNGKHGSMQSALDAVFEAGYDVAKIDASATDNKILWDQTNDVFCYLNEGNIEYIPDSAETPLTAGDYRLWVISDTVDENYSTYYTGEAANVPAELKKGFDAGKVTGITTLKYVGVGTAQEVVIRTNTANTTLTIDAKNDTVNHYDTVGKVDVQKIDLHCYNEYGKASYITITEGKLVAKDGSVIGVVFANNTDSSKVAVSKDNNGIIKKALTTVAAVDANNFANYSVHLEYSADGTTPYTASQIESIGELSIASETGVQPQGMDYTAVVNLVGYNSLQEAINAASDGDVVSLLKDYSTSDETLVISKDITLKGNNHSIENKRAKTASTYNDNISGRDAAIYVNSNVTFEDLNLTTTKLCLIHVQSSCTNKTINLNNCVMSAPTNAYGFFVANGADKLNININNTTLRGWCAAYLKCSNSTINVNDSVLTGVNGATQAPSNGFGTFVIDGNMSSGDTTYGSNNNVKISNTDIYANTDTDAGANVEIWLLIQYRAHNNTVVVTGGNIYSTNPIAPEKGWEYHHKSGSDEDVQSTNTVTVNGVQYYGFPSNHD